jgi:hypothetical protein
MIKTLKKEVQALKTVYSPTNVDLQKRCKGGVRIEVRAIIDAYNHDFQYTKQELVEDITTTYVDKNLKPLKKDLYSLGHYIMRGTLVKRQRETETEYRSRLKKFFIQPVLHRFDELSYSV